MGIRNLVAGTSIPPFPLGTATSSDFIWLDSKSWYHKDLLYYLEAKKFPQGSCATAPAINRKAQRFISQGHWVLAVNGEADPQAWADLQVFEHAFCRSFLFVGHKGHKKTNPLIKESITFLITAIFAESESDVLYLVGPKYIQRDLLVYEGVEEATWYELSPSRSCLRPLTAIKIPAVAWNQTPANNKYSDDLRHIKYRAQRRKARNLRQTSNKKRPRYRGLLGFLFPKR